MTDDIKRRSFLRLGAAFGSLPLAACGGGSGATDPAPTPPAPSPPPEPPPEPPPAPAPAPGTRPAWLEGQPLNTWIAIPGTVHAGSPAAPVDDPNDPYASSNRRLAFSGMGLRDAEIILAADGGHGDYSGNEVTSLDLSRDAPAWVLRSAASTSVATNVPYYPDGKPSSRHTYWSTIWNAQHNRLMLHYTRFCYGSGVSFPNSNGFDLDTNTWDPQGTWADGYSAGCADDSGNCYAMGVGYFALNKWTAATDTWSTVATFADAINVNPVCYDTRRGHLFALAWGDGQGDGSGLSALRFAGAARTSITFNASTALTQFLADMPAYSAMEYDPVNDQYLFYEGGAGRTGRVYVVKPNETAVWDISILALGAGSATPPAAVGAGVYNRFKYVAALGGFVSMNSGTSDVYFLRTS